MKPLIFVITILLFNTCIAQSKKGFDLKNSIIPISEIMDGGPPKDGIPAIDNPKFIKGSKVKLEGTDRVLGVFFNGIAKAYPVRILNYHEIVNDHFGSEPVVVTYCPLCGSGIAFSSKIMGKPATFGVSGLLYNSDVLLYDRETESLWSQLMFKAVSGPLVNQKLEPLPTTNTTWKNWRNKYPDSLVLSEETGFNRNYSHNPYPDYSSSSNLFFPVSGNDDRYHPKEVVIGIIINGKPKAYPLVELNKSEKGSIMDKFQGKNLRIEFSEEGNSAEIFDENGKLIPSVSNFWFAWYAFYPETEVFISK